MLAINDDIIVSRIILSMDGVFLRSEIKERIEECGINITNKKLTEILSSIVKTPYVEYHNFSYKVIKHNRR